MFFRACENRHLTDAKKNRCKNNKNNISNVSSFRPAQNNNNFQHQNDRRNPSIAIPRRLSFHADQNDVH